MKSNTCLKAGLGACRGRRARGGLLHVVMLHVVIICSCLASVAAPGTVPGLRIFSNLRVLPEDISTAQLLENMKAMTIALGVECRTCHRTDIRDFASDEVEAKLTAREMMRMMAQMNLKSPQRGEGNPAGTTCFDCHQGRLRPGNF